MSRPSNKERMLEMVDEIRRDIESGRAWLDAQEAMKDG